MNIFANPRVRVVIAIIVTTAIAIGIGLLMSRLLNSPQPPAQKNCSKDAHLDENLNKCVPNCQDGYKNDVLTGECVIECPEGQVSSKSITTVTIPGKERCVIPCGSDSCDPETSVNLCQDGICYEPNCKTTDNKPSHCKPPLKCGTDSNGKKNTTVPKGITLDTYGCYRPPTPPPPLCSDPTPILVKGTGVYSDTHVCCTSTEFKKFSPEGEPFCCPNDDDVIVNKNCCPKDKACPQDNPTDCLDTDQVCTLEGPCKKTNAIGTPGNYTGCCPFTTYNGECYNMCTYVGSSDTGMADTCTTDPDCNFKSGFSFDGMSTTGGKCVGGKCKLYCGPADVSDQGNIVCLNDDNSKSSTCINTRKMCKYDAGPAYNPDSEQGVYICNDYTTNPPTSYWKSSSGAPTLTKTLTQASGSGPCSALSCLERTISTGMLSDNVTITTNGKQQTIPQTNISTIVTNDGQTCEAKYECNKMSITSDGRSVEWKNQNAPSEHVATILTQISDGVFNGTWTGGSCITNPGECVFLTNGLYAPNGTLDGITPSDRALSGKGCQPASYTSPNSTYPTGVRCNNITSNDTAGGYSISPNYYCTSWGSCCGNGGVVKQGDQNTCMPTQISVNQNGQYNYKSTPKGNLSSFNNIGGNSIRGRKILPNVQILDASGSMNIQPDNGAIINNPSIKLNNLQRGISLILMKINGKPITFNPEGILHAGDGSDVINFYYYYSVFDKIEKTDAKTGTYQLPLLKGYFAAGSGPDACEADTNVADGSVWSYPGIPIRVKAGDNYAHRDMSWGAKDYDNGYNLTIVYTPENNQHYLAAIKCYYYVTTVAWVQMNESSNDDTVYYGKIDTDGKISFTETDYKNADSFDQLIVLGMGKTTGNTAPWYSKSPDNGFINAEMQNLLLCGMVSQSVGNAEYCNNLNASNQWITDQTNLTYNNLKQRIYNNYR